MEQLLDVEALREQAYGYGQTVLGWLQSPAFLSQVGAIVVAIILARILTAQVRKRVPLLRDEPKEGRFLFLRQFVYQARGLLFSVLLVALLAAIIPALLAATGSAWLARLAQGLALVLLLHNALKTFIPSDGIRKIVSLIVLPSAILMVFGQFDAFTAFLDTISLELGNIRISLLFALKAAIFGGLLFWLGSHSNIMGQKAIRSQETLDTGMKELISKLFQIALYFIIFIVFMQLLGLNLTTLAVLGGAIGVGLGFGLQQIAANFISGMIILFERSLTPGDFIEMEDGKAGILKEINMRSTTLATFDGKEIMVPNEKFITTAFTNWTRDSPKQRYEVEFSVAYGTDIDRLVPLITEVVSTHPQVLQDPEPTDTEMRGFGDSGINMAVEFWADGIDDGKNRFSADVLLLIWRTLRDNDIEIPFPQHEVRILGDRPKLEIKKKEG